MPDINDEIQLSAILKSVRRPVRVSPAVRERVLYNVLAKPSEESVTNPRFFLFRPPVWISIMTIVALTLISFGMVMPPG